MHRCCLVKIELEADCFYWPTCRSHFTDTNSCKLAEKIVCKVMIAKQFGMHCMGLQAARKSRAQSRRMSQHRAEWMEEIVQ